MSSINPVAITGLEQPHSNALQAKYDTRLIILAQGKQFHSEELPPMWRVPDGLLLSGAERKTDCEDEIRGYRDYLNSKKPSANAPPKVQSEWLKYKQEHEKWAQTRRIQCKPLEAHQKIDLVPSKEDNEWTFLNKEQGVFYILRLVTTKKAFLKYLREPLDSFRYSGVHVVYGGHARYGRGPCFGTANGKGISDAPGDEWEDGVGPHPNETGIFRLGYPYIAVPIEEIFEHGYVATLAPHTAKLTKDNCDPELWAEWKKLAAPQTATIEKLQAMVPQKLCMKHLTCPHCGAGPHTLANHIEDRQKQIPPADTKYLYYKNAKGELHVVLDAGWKDTKSSPDDFGHQPPACKVFCHFGCSTYSHNYRVIREFAGWKQSGDDAYAIFTTAIALNVTPFLWLQHLFTYNQPSAGKKWKDAIEYAYAKTRADLRTGQFGFSITDGRAAKAPPK